MLVEYIRGVVNMGVIGIENKICFICIYIWMNKYKFYLKGVFLNLGKKLEKV